MYDEQNALDFEGVFRAKPIEQGIKQFDGSRAVAISIRYCITEQLSNGKWRDVSNNRYVVSGDHWIVKKDGTPSEKIVRQLKEFFGWDGDLADLTNLDWGEKVVQVTVKSEEYEGTTRYNVSWINPRDYTPGTAVCNVDESVVTQLATRYGAQLRAICGGAHAVSVPTPPTSSPMSPPPRSISSSTPSSKESAWAACLKSNQGDQAKAKDDWFEKLLSIGKDESVFDANDWSEVEGLFLPF